MQDTVLKELIVSFFGKLSEDRERIDCMARLREEYCLKCGNHTPESKCRCNR